MFPFSNIHRNTGGIMHNNLYKPIILIFIVLFFFACATVTPMRPITSNPERIVEKNYEINKLQKVYVGEEIIKVKDYWVTHVTQNKMRCLNDFTLTNSRFFNDSAKKGDTFNVIGTTIHDNRRLYLIKFQNPNITAFYGITEFGEWADFGVFGGNTGTPEFKLNPENTKFELVKETKINTSQGFINFEIIFNGTTKDSINFLYREYTPENMARPAFYQNLTYPIDSDVIRFKEIKIKINEITNESISYVVLNDGLPD